MGINLKVNSSLWYALISISVNGVSLSCGAICSPPLTSISMSLSLFWNWFEVPSCPNGEGAKPEFRLFWNGLTGLFSA